MSHATSEDAGTQRRRRRLVAAVKESLREARSALSLFSRNVGASLDLKDVDMDCLDLINLQGPLSPSDLTRRTGLHPATMTGVLDRLERSGWVARERHSSDRRAVVVVAQRHRNADVYELLAAMNTAMDKICVRYTDSDLEVIADFLRRTANAGRDAGDNLTEG